MIPMRPVLGSLPVLAAVALLAACEMSSVPDGATAAAARAAEAATGVEYLTPFGAPTRPFSPAVRVGELLFLSGQIGTDASASGNTVVPGGIEAETRQTMENIKRVLESVGSSMDRVVKCTVYLADIAEFQAMNAEYRTFFPSEPPARTTVAVSGLVADARIEVTCLALAGAP